MHRSPVLMGAVALVVLATIGCSWGATPEPPPPPSTPDPAPVRTRPRGRALEDGRTQVVELEVGGRERRYRVVPPDDYDPDREWPVVLSFHGGGDGNTGRKAERHWQRQRGDDVFLVFPDASDGIWRMPSRPDVDETVDVKFTRAVIDDLDRRFNIDTDRVYATGFSNGAMLVWELACSDPGRYAGFAVISAGMTRATFEGCKPSVTRPLLYMHGSADPNIGGGTIAEERFRGGVELVGAEETLDLLERLYRCDSLVDAGTIDACGGRKVHRQRLEGCRSRAPMTFLKIDGGTHQWPSTRGPRCSIDASEEILKFFDLD